MRLRGWLIALLVLGVVAGGLYLGDRYAEHRVEERTAAELQSALGTPDQPTVEIIESPFLTQAAAQSFARIEMEARQVGAMTENPLILAHLDLVLTDVSTDDWFASMTAAHGEGNALIDWPVMQTLIGSPLRYLGNGRVEIISTTTIVGRDVRATITGTPRLDVDTQTIVLSEPTVTVGELDLPKFTAEAVIRAVLKVVSLEELPLELRATAITSQEDGIRTDVVGENVPVAR
jgi:hypothetical protein